MSLIVGDIEAPGLLHEWDECADKIDCLVLDIDGQVLDYAEGTQHKQWFNTGDTIVFHNGIDYDLPMLLKHWGWDYTIGPDSLLGTPVKIVDTMLLSKLLWPDRPMPKGFEGKWKPSYAGEKMPGPHSLEVWAYRLNTTKPKLVYGPNMGKVPHEVSVAQCKADVEITKAVYHYLVDEAKRRRADLRRALAVEQKVRFIISEGAAEGVPFDSELAERCLNELDVLMDELEKEVEPELPQRKIPKSRVKPPPKNRFKKDGEPTARAEQYFGDLLKPYLDSWYVYYPDDTAPTHLGKADRPLVDTEAMSISDREVKDWLIHEHGWKPTLWNTTKDKETGRKTRTSPKFHQQGKLCENLEQLGETVEIVRKIVKYLSYRNRRSVIKSKDGDTGWLNHPRLPIDGKLPADADTMGTNTFRFTHRVVANVPRPGTTYGEEMRSMYHAPEGQFMVGWDASGLEDRCKAHYTFEMPGGAAYAEKILNPDFDVHTENMESWGLPRPKCKNGHYAMQYNCRPPKLAETLGVPQAQADDYYEAWWSNNLPLRYFIEQATPIWHSMDKQWLPAIDGRWVPCPYEYMIASRLFQSAGVIAMKYAMVLWYNRIHKLSLPAKQIIHYHDEAQSLVVGDEELAHRVGTIGQWSIKRAGELLNFRVPLLSEYKVGRSWSDTH